MNSLPNIYTLISEKRSTNGLNTQKIMLSALLFVSVGCFADCETDESRFASELQAHISETPDGICDTARSMIPILKKGISFYRNCPMNDPSGQMIENLQQQLETFQETARKTCSS